MTINDPRDIPDLLVWYSADYEATQYADGATVTVLHDLSGNGNDSTGVVGTPKLRATAGPSGGPAVEFDGPYRYTLPHTLSGKTSAEVHSTTKSGSANAGPYHFGTFAEGGSLYPYVDGLTYLDFASTTRQNSIDTAAKPITSWRRVNMWSAAGDWAFLLDETSIRTSPSNTVGFTSSPLIGQSGALTGLLYHGGIVLFGRKLNSTERADLVTWLTANPSGGLPVTLDPPGVPTSVVVTPGIVDADMTWGIPASGGDVDGYEVRLDSGTIVDSGVDLEHAFSGLTAATEYDFEVRAYGPGGESDWVLVTASTLPVPPATPVVYLGSGEDELETFTTTHSIQVRRGLTANGVTENLEPGVCIVVFVDDTLNPLTNELTRPGRPLRVGVEEFIEDEFVFTPIFTGEIDRGELEIDKDTGKTRLVLTAYDAVPFLAGHPYATAHAGTFSQRVTPVLEDAGVDYLVHDDDPDEATGTLLTEQNTALAQLVLARDTLHGFFYVDRDNVVQAYADDQRSRDDATVILTDGSEAGLDYVGIEPGFDTDDLVNVLTIRTLDTPDPVEETFTDEASVTEWKKKAQTVTVNDLDAEFHWLRFTARLTGPALTAKQVRLNAVKIDALAAIAALDLYQPVRVVRDGLIDQEQQILHLVHEINHYRLPYAFKWMTTVTTRKRELLPLRWMDVPDDITWDDLDPTMTWNTAIYWHP